MTIARAQRTQETTPMRPSAIVLIGTLLAILAAIVALGAVEFAASMKRQSMRRAERRAAEQKHQRELRELGVAPIPGASITVESARR